MTTQYIVLCTVPNQMKTSYGPYSEQEAQQLSSILEVEAEKDEIVKGTIFEIVSVMHVPPSLDL